MKKLLSVILTLTLILSALPLGLFSITASAETSGYYTYSVSNGEATITDVDTSISGDVTIPATLGGYPVTSIGREAFSGCTGLFSVTVPDSVASIGDGAFYGCIGLISITLPFVGSSRAASETYDAVFGYVFGYVSYNADGTTKQYYGSGSYEHYYIPSSLKTVVITDATRIPYGAFHNCTGLTSVTIPDSVTGIGQGAFRGCTGLTSVTIPDSVTSTGSYAFDHCAGLASVTIGNNVTSIGESAFQQCHSLTSVTIPDSVTSIGSSAFYSCDGLTSVTIQEGVTSIGDIAFYDCANLTSVTIPDSVKSIGRDVFLHCTDLKYNIYGNGKYLGNETNPNVCLWDVTSDKITTFSFAPDVKIIVNAFYHCKGLTSVTIPNSVTYIGDSAFEYCTDLTSVTIPDSVTSIGYGAFSGCSGLTSITIPDSVTSIGYGAFSGCDGLDSVTIPDSVTSIGDRAFYGCTGLEEVHITDLAAWCGIEFGSAEANPLYYAEKLYINGTLARNIAIPDSITSIGYAAFFGCAGLTSVTIPDSVTSIGGSAFSRCASLTSVTIPDSVTSIGASAFARCASLTSVTIPNSVTSIGHAAFYGCNSLASITLPFVGSSRAASETYDAVFGYIFGCSTSANPYETTKQYYVFYNFEHYDIPSSLKTVVITDATQIPYGAFYGCAKLTSITIPNSVTSIGGEAFSGCTGLEKIICVKGSAVDVYARRNNINVEYLFISGDLTGDDKINSLDGLMLMRYLNGWENLNIASPEAMDVNADGKVNSLDGLLLMRYLNGWNVQLG